MAGPGHVQHIKPISFHSMSLLRRWTRKSPSHVRFDNHAVQVCALSGSRSVLWGSGLLAVVLQSWQSVPALGSACAMSRVCHNSCLHAHVRFDNHAVQVGAISGSRSVLWGSGLLAVVLQSWQPVLALGSARIIAHYITALFGVAEQPLATPHPVSTKEPVVCNGRASVSCMSQFLLACSCWYGWRFDDGMLPANTTRSS